MRIHYILIHKALLSAVPVPDPDFKREQIILKGDIPSPANPPTGCAFHTRCPFKMEYVHQVVPQLVEVENRSFCCVSSYIMASATMINKYKYGGVIKWRKRKLCHYAVVSV